MAASQAQSLMPVASPQQQQMRQQTSPAPSQQQYQLQQANQVSQLAHLSHMSAQLQRQNSAGTLQSYRFVHMYPEVVSNLDFDDIKLK